MEAPERAATAAVEQDKACGVNPTNISLASHNFSAINISAYYLRAWVMKFVADPTVFDETPELGMGFHFGECSENRVNDRLFIVFNQEIALNASELTGCDLRAAGKQFRSKDESAEDLDFVPIVPCEDRTRLLSFMALLAAPVPAWAAGHPDRKVHGSPPFSGLSTSRDVFHRVSAFKNDRRILSDGSVRLGTYVTSHSDWHMIRNALSAVGRYALPNITPPIHHFEIKPLFRTPLLYGTVVPAFGQSGGGAEMEFTVGLPKGAAVYKGTIREW